MVMSIAAIKITDIITQKQNLMIAAIHLNLITLYQLTIQVQKPILLTFTATPPAAVPTPLL